MARWRGTFANLTHTIVSLLKAWKMTEIVDRVWCLHLLTSFQEGLEVTMVGMECDSATF